MPRLPSITSKLPPDVRRFLDRVREAFEGSDRVVSVNDLVSSGGYSVTNSGALQPVTGTSSCIAPPAPTAVSADGAMTSIIITWEGTNYSSACHAYTEIWRAPTDDLPSAVLIGTSNSEIYTDAVGSDAIAFYWLRFVNTNDVSGAYHSVNGTRGQTAPDIEYLMDMLADHYGSDSLSPFFQIDTNLITTIGGKQVTIPPGTYIKTAFVHEAAINSAQIRDAAITNAKIANLAVDTAKIANAAITTAQIANAAIVSAHIGTAAVNNAHIGNAAIGTANIKTAAVGTAQIQEAAITSAKIEDAAITAAKIEDASITSAKIGDAAITSAKIGDAVIENAMIKDLTVTGAKIGFEQVTKSVGAYAQNSVTIGGGGTFANIGPTYSRDDLAYAQSGTVLSVTFEGTGRPMNIHAALFMYPIIYESGGDDVVFTPRYWAWLVRRKDQQETILHGGQLIADLMGTIVFNYRDNPAEGVVSYLIKVTGGANYGVVASRSLVVTELKR